MTSSVTSKIGQERLMSWIGREEIAEDTVSATPIAALSRDP